jgi:hypothetical protein
MRLRLLLAATALFATPPAIAGVTAYYRVGRAPDQRLMVVEVNDQGDSRTDLGDGRAMLVLGGVAYIVRTDAVGTYVARLEDDIDPDTVVISGSRRLPADILEHRGPRLPAPSRVQLVRMGTEIVGGRRGTVWRVVSRSAPANGSVEEFVVSDEPELAPLRNILGPRQPNPPDPALDPTGAAAARWTAHRSGTILREGQHLRLERVELGPIPEAYSLPSPPLRGEALVARARQGER